jgi:hypothetical protein
MKSMVQWSEVADELLRPIYSRIETCVETLF